MPAKKHLDELAQFIRDHRSSEANFQALYEKLKTEQAAAASEGAKDAYAGQLKEVIENYVAAYQQQRAEGNSAWPEFENMVTHFEKAVLQALHAAD